MSETTGPRELVRNAQLAEEAGFDFVGLSDHHLPWLESHGHSPFAWSVLGAIAETTERVGIATGLTCPIIRGKKDCSHTAANITKSGAPVFTICRKSRCPS